MASIIRIKRSSVAGNPSTLAAGELAYSALTDNGSNGGDRLYIGIGTETAGDAANHFVIGGKFFTDRLDHTAGTLTASSALVVDSNSKIDNFLVDNLQLNGNTLSTTNTNGNLLLTPDGTGKTVVKNLHIGDDTTSIAEFIYDTVGGAITAGTGITITNNDAGNTSTVSITNTAVTAGSYGSATAIPTFTVNAQGQLTAAGTASLATNLNIAGDTGTDSVALLTDTITFVGGTGITSAVTAVGTATSVTFDIDSTVATLTGSQTLTNKTINLANNTLTATSAQLAAAISDETGTGVVVFSNTPTLVTPVLGVATATTINKVTITAPTNGSTLTIADGKTLTANNTLTFTGTDTSSVAFGTGGTVAYTANKLNVFAATSSSELAGVISDETGTGALVFANTPTLVTPVLGAATATSITGSSSTITISAASGNNNVNLVPTGTGSVDVGSKRITSVATPESDTDAANKGYVDNAIAGLSWKEAVHLLASTNVALTGSTNTLNIDTHGALDSTDSGYRILLLGQTTTANNGIYVYTDNGTSYTLTRATDADAFGELVGASVFVQEGTIYAKTGWLQSNHYLSSFSGQTWVQFSGAGTYGAGAGLTLTGNVFDVGGTTNRITVNADSVDIASTYVGQSSITTLGTIGTGIWQGTVVDPTYGGTGVNNGAKTITLGGSFTHTGAHTLGLTTTANTSVTLPITGTLATLAGSEALSNKTITASSFAGSVAATTLSASGLVTLTNTTDAGPLGTAAVVLSGGLSVAKKIYVGTDIIGAGAATSTLDGFNIDGGTY